MSGRFQHLAIHDASGRHLHDLTSGEWVVTDVAAVDEANRVVYFHGTRESAIERHLYRVSLDGGPVERITEGAGWRRWSRRAPGCMSITGRTWGASPTVTLRRLEGNGEVATLFADEAATAEARWGCGAG
ncbi:MAG: DPP IV N-terminal domain-containing protein [Chloroflexia bacterium]